MIGGYYVKGGLLCTRDNDSDVAAYNCISYVTESIKHDCHPDMLDAVA